MNDRCTYDAFLSYSKEDLQSARGLHEELQACGLKVFIADERTRIENSGGPHAEGLLAKLKDCQHFILYVTPDSGRSSWVDTECDYFHELCHLEDKQNRRMFVFSPDPEHDIHIPRKMQTSHRLRSPGQLMSVLARLTIARLTERLEYEENRVLEAFRDYHYSRFWRPGWGKRNGIHVFTCARDMPFSEEMRRGRSGRTNIDKWDYQTVLDLTRFFGTRYPDVNVTIEDPVSKLSLADLQSPCAGDTNAEMRGKLRNRDCVIVGSPDVSDFAEVVLAKVHGIRAYTETKEKSKGFVHIKEKQQTPSCGYWIKGPNDHEGIARIDGPGKIITYKATTAGRVETTYGVLVVADNPFNDPGVKSTILILSGFTGIATNGIAKLITDKRYRAEFYRLDQRVEVDMQFEALISTRFRFIDDKIGARDARELDPADDAIQFKELVKI